MNRQYWYITFDCGDGSAGTHWFSSKELWLLWFEMNDGDIPVLDDGSMVINGTIDESYLTSEKDIIDQLG